MNSFLALCAGERIETQCEPAPYELVIHRKIVLGGFCETQWSVSDPVCGAMVCEGKGRAGALETLERIRRRFGSTGAFLVELYRQRERIERGLPPTDRSGPH